MQITVVSTKGDSTGNIDDLISTLQKAKEKGATNYNMRWSSDPIWAFKWFELYFSKSAEEIKEDQRKELQKKLDELK
jgi:hypothetical protein